MLRDKRVEYLMSHFERGTTFLFINDYPWEMMDNFCLVDSGYNFICVGRGQDYWPFMLKDKIVICYSSIFQDDDKEQKLNCYPLHCPIFVYNKNCAINAEDRDVRVWAEVLNEGELSNEDIQI